MLRGLALRHCFDEIQGRNLIWPEPVQVTRGCFITAEHTRILLR